MTQNTKVKYLIYFTYVAQHTNGAACLLGFLYGLSSLSEGKLPLGFFELAVSVANGLLCLTQIDLRKKLRALD